MYDIVNVISSCLRLCFLETFDFCHVNFLGGQSSFFLCFWKNREAAYFFHPPGAGVGVGVLLARIFTDMLFTGHLGETFINQKFNWNFAYRTLDGILQISLMKFREIPPSANISCTAWNKLQSIFEEEH